ncbi:AAA family ATPase, partial [Streptomyces rubrogriseus]|nr:AAA family ATPase [Streptomyces rubrogriseus]
MKNGERARAGHDSPADPGPAVVGREAEIAEIRSRVAADRSHSSVLVVEGDPGVGKSVLLDLAVRLTRDTGQRVLKAVGSESETPLAFAGLHQLLRPVLRSLDGLPARQRSALRTALGLAEDAGDAGDAEHTDHADHADHASTPDALLVGLAVLTLLSDLSEPAPLLVVVDDAQWIDRASLDVLSFLARRMAGEPVTLLMGVRAAAVLPGFDKGYERLEIGPLSGDAANRLLDEQPKRPTGRTRARILREAAGNPLALVELARAAADREPEGSGVEGPLPVTDRLEGIFARHLRLLPEATRRALLLLAAADAADAPAAAR